MRAVVIWISMVLATAGALAAASSAAELRTMTAPDIRALQQRLTDGQCYTGAIDGTPSTATEEAIKRCPAMDPMLRIETGMHTAMIRRIGVDRACRLLATSSEDKTVRLWSLPEGRLMQTLRPPIGPGDDGKVYAVAVSPDGTLVAAGGYDARWSSQQNHSVYLFDVRTGSLKGRVGAFGDVIDHLAFSADGRYLAASLGGGNGLAVIDIESMAVAATDADYSDDSYGAAFAPDGRLFTVAWDGYLRRYDADLRLAGKVKTRGGKHPHSVAANPDGKSIAVGFEDSKNVDVYYTADLRFAFAADTRGMASNGDLSKVAWSSDGRKLAAGGNNLKIGADRQWHSRAAIWDQDGRGKRSEQPVSLAAIMAIQPCPDGFAVGAQDPLFALLDRNGATRLSRSGVSADMRYKLGDALQVSRDGRQVRFGLEYAASRPVLFDLTRSTLREGERGTGLTTPRTSGIAVTDWQNTTTPKFAGQALRIDPGETARSLAITPDMRGFVLGTEYWLRGYSASGQELWPAKEVLGVAWGVNVTGDGRIVVGSYGDGTIRWHRMSDGQELLALFVNKDDLRWVAWTPSGYYLASPGAEDMIGWHVNRGWEQAADFFPASRFRERFSRPDVVQKVLDTLDETKAVEQANREANIRNDAAAPKLPPVITIISPRDGDTVRQTDVRVEYEVRTPSGQPVDGVEVLIDGRPTRGFKRVDGNPRTERQVITLPARDVELGLMARSGALASTVATVRLKWAAAPPTSSPDDLLKPKLYGVIVGVSAYQDPSLNLVYAAKDAHDFAAALAAQKGGLYRDIELKVLMDADATAASVKDALAWLEEAVTSRDVGVVFMAGHGQVDVKNRFYYFATDTKPDQLVRTGVEGTLLREHARAVAGKMLVFLDTCYAGKAMVRGFARANDVNAFVNELSSTENGVVTYASSTGSEMSQEDSTWGNGAFTKALLEGLGLAGGKSRADIAGKGVITTAAMDYWISERVKELTHGSQHPVMIRPATVPDFPMFVAKR